MNKPFQFLLLMMMLAGKSAFSQTALPLPANIQKACTQSTRSETGTPGKSYWQNRADYAIQVNFNPLNRELTGTVGIDYVNNSPDTLKRVWFKLYPNLYQKESVRAVPVAAKDLTDGVHIVAVKIDNSLMDSTHRTIRGTNMILKDTKVLPHQHVHYDITYAYTLNKGSFIRTGQIDSGAFFYCLFFSASGCI